MHKSSIIHKGDPTLPHPTPFPPGPQIDEVEEDVVWVVERRIRIISCLLFMTFIELQFESGEVEWDVAQKERVRWRHGVARL